MMWWADRLTTNLNLPSRQTKTVRRLGSALRNGNSDLFSYLWNNIQDCLRGPDILLLPPDSLFPHEGVGVVSNIQKEIDLFRIEGNYVRTELEEEIKLHIDVGFFPFILMPTEQVDEHEQLVCGW